MKPHIKVNGIDKKFIEFYERKLDEINKLDNKNSTIKNNETDLEDISKQCTKTVRIEVLALPEAGEAETEYTASPEDEKLEDIFANYTNSNNESNEEAREPDVILNADENTRSENANYINEEIEKFILELKKFDYRIAGGKLFYYGGTTRKEVSNFIPIITKKVIRKNGAEEKISYKLQAYLLDDDRKLEEIEVTKKELDTFKFIIGSNSNWDEFAICRPGKNAQLREVAQISAKYTMKEEIIIENTGFERINNELVYLYHRGNVGGQADIQADLTEGQLEKYAFTDEEFDIKEALKCSCDVFEIANLKVTIPTMGYIFIVVLTSLLKEKNIFCDFVLMFVGSTNTGKSSVAAIANSFWGKFTRNSFASSLNDSIPKIARQSFLLKDAILVPDDLPPQSDKSKENLVNSLLGIWGDRAGFGRAKMDGTVRGSNPARGGAILTAEYVPDLNQSRLARAVILEFNKKTVNLEKLLKMQEDIEKLSFCLKQYIKFVIENEEEILEKCTEIIKKLQKSQLNKWKNVLGRSKEQRNILYLGMYLYATFLNYNDVINEEEKNNLLNKADEVLNEVMLEQLEFVEESGPVAMFYSAINILLKTEKINLLDYKTGEPINSRGVLVGYIDREKETYYFFWNKNEHLIYDFVYKFYSNKRKKFIWIPPVFLKILDSEGVLYMTDDSRKTVKRRDPLTKGKHDVIQVPIKFDADGETTIEETD